MLAVFAIYAALPMVALSALPVHKGADGKYTTLLGTTEDKGGFAGDPVLGIVKHLHLGALQSAGEIYVGLLAATILFIAANAGIIGASRLVYSMGLHRQVPDRLSRLHPRFSTPWIGILLFGGVACLTIIPGQGRIPRQHVRVRGDAVVHDRAPVGDPPAHQGARPAAARTAGPGTLRVAGRELPVFALLGILGTGLAFVVVTVLHLAVAAAGVFWLAFGMVPLRRSTASSRGSTCARPPRRRAPSARRTSRSSTTAPRSCRSSARTSARACSGTPPS